MLAVLEQTQCAETPLQLLLGDAGTHDGCDQTGQHKRGALATMEGRGDGTGTDGRDGRRGGGAIGTTRAEGGEGGEEGGEGEGGVGEGGCRKFEKFKSGGMIACGDDG